MAQINTRILMKYDTLANWNSSTFKLMKGEIAVVALGNTVDGSAAKANHPVLFKVGTGEHTFAELPYASALAADVYAWAKAADVSLVGKTLTFSDSEGTAIKTIPIPYITDAEAQTKIDAALAAYSTTEQMNAAIAAEIAKLAMPEGGFAAKSDFDALKEKVEDEDGAMARANEAYTLADGKTTMAEVEGKGYAVLTAIQGSLDLADTAVQPGALTTTLSGYYTKSEADAAFMDATETDSAIDAKITAANLGQYVTKEDGKSLIADTEITRLAGIETGAEVNVIETVKVNGVALTPDTDRAVDVTVPTEEQIKSLAADQINTLIAGADDEGGETIQNIINLVDYVEKNAGEIAQLTTDVATAKSDAATAKADAAEALTKANEAIDANSGAQAAKEAAEAAQAAAEAAQAAAATSQGQAAASATAAGESATAAAGSAGTAASEAAAASASATAAGESAAAASASATTAGEQAAAASASAGAAATSEAAALAAQSAAETAQAAAEAARDEAVNSNTSATAVANEAKAAAEAATTASNAATEAVAGLKEIASTGSIYDVVEVDSATSEAGATVDCLIFYCGTASDLV